jgi:hypothetical protein
MQYFLGNRQATIRDSSQIELDVEIAHDRLQYLSLRKKQPTQLILFWEKCSRTYIVDGLQLLTSAIF